MTVDPVWNYDGKVAEVRSDRGDRGYLLVRLTDATWSDGKRGTAVDLSVVLKADESDQPSWRFSDRADPDPDDARTELVDGRIEWFGQVLHVQRWLGAADAQAVVTEHFA
ncbi:hypothetical protein ABZ570_05870 [Micromonospora sp. NPDC007271]|uniref:hypothetical protein n=1 Tax=Micromonospora sp. NPDC007271 TaxID=3154587 RepID=UPI0033E4D5F4